MTTATEVQMVPVDAITVLNPRARNRRVFHELITSIAHLGLKKPITVSRREGEPGYDLVCGQGRLEAFIALGQSEIPAIVIEASQEDCYVMSLVENLARRHPGSLELMREIGALKERGYNSAEIAAKTDFTPDYIAAICYLLEHGEERLLVAVERGVMPANESQSRLPAPPTAMSNGRSPRHMRRSCSPGTRCWQLGGSFCSGVSVARSPTEAVASRTPERLPRRR
jgi:ParB/RepB/Spo0J family partition protein